MPLSMIGTDCRLSGFFVDRADLGRQDLEFPPTHETGGGDGTAIGIDIGERIAFRIEMIEIAADRRN